MSDLKTEAQVRTRADLIYQSLYAAAIGGSAVALYFLVIDAWNGRLLFTPSVIGGVLFGGLDAHAVDEVRLDWVAYATFAHFLVFAAVGTAATLVAHWVELRTHNPAAVLFGLFAAIEWCFFVGAHLVMPGLIEVLGFWRVAMANLLAALGIVAFLWASHQPQQWERLKHATHLA